MFYWYIYSIHIKLEKWIDALLRIYFNCHLFTSDNKSLEIADIEHVNNKHKVCFGATQFCILFFFMAIPFKKKIGYIIIYMNHYILY